MASTARRPGIKPLLSLRGGVALTLPWALRLFACLLLVVLLLSSCSLFGPRTVLIRRPSNIVAPEGSRPWAFLDLRPQGYQDYIVGVSLPSGKTGYIELGRAMESALIEGLGGYLKIDLVPKFNKYIVEVDLDRMRVETKTEAGEAGAWKVRLGLKFEFVVLESLRGRELYRAEVGAEGEGLVAGDGDEEYLAGLTRLAEEVLVKAEQGLAEEIRKSAGVVKYKVRR